MRRRVVACLGDSLTDANAGRCNVHTSGMWPSLLQQALGERSFEVQNFGASGVPAIHYHDWGPLSEALRVQPDAVVIMLGTNDAWCWNEEWYRHALTHMIASFKSLSVAPSMILLLVPPPL